MKNLFITFPSWASLYILQVYCCYLNSFFDSQVLFTLLFSTIIVSVWYYIFFAGKKVLQGIKEAGKIILIGAGAKAGSDLYDSGKELYGDYKKGGDSSKNNPSSQSSGNNSSDNKSSTNNPSNNSSGNNSSNNGSNDTSNNSNSNGKK